MTLVVAGLTDSSIWMVSDTAVTGGPIGLRKQEYLPKIEASKFGSSLIAFAGDAVHGLKLLRAATVEKNSEKAIRILLDGSRGKNVEFAYAYFDALGPHLLLVTDGNVENRQNLYLGSKDAFHTFQRIRHGEISPYAPLALKLFRCGAKVSASEELRSAVATAIANMIDVFASRAETDVGGWAVPYFLTPDGAYFVSYCYSVSDPLFDRLAPGDLITHGTSEEGGASLSVTELENGEVMIVYWLQLPGGTVLIKDNDGYAPPRKFFGPPSEFKAAAAASLGRDIDLWIGDQPLGPVQRIHIMRDASGAPTLAMARHENGFSHAIHNLVTPFNSAAEFTMNNSSANISSIGVEVAEDRGCVRLKCNASERTAIDVNLTAAEVDNLLLQLAEARAELSPKVPLELVQGTNVFTVRDPCWRTYANVHPELQGVVVNMRHLGYGWLGFLLPPKEARALGSLLVEYGQNEDLKDHSV